MITLEQGALLMVLGFVLVYAVQRVFGVIKKDKRSRKEHIKGEGNAQDLLDFDEEQFAEELTKKARDRAERKAREMAHHVEDSDIILNFELVIGDESSGVRFSADITQGSFKRPVGDPKVLRKMLESFTTAVEDFEASLKTGDGSVRSVIVTEVIDKRTGKVIESREVKVPEGTNPDDVLQVVIKDAKEKSKKH